MKAVLRVLSALLVACSAFAQYPDIRPVAGETMSLVKSLQREYERLYINLLDSARRMPEADYTFTPSIDIRNFGDLMGHVANSHFGACAVLKGVPSPSQGMNIPGKQTKAEFVKLMEDSFAFCSDAFSSLTQEKVLEFVKERDGLITRLGVIAHMIAHSNEVYGTAAVYMRMRNLVPPTTDHGMGSRSPDAVANCLNTSVLGTVTSANAVNGEMSVLTTNGVTLKLRADLNTKFLIPNARPEDLHTVALAKSLPNSKVQVEYCTKELWVREVTVMK
jgi:hypothetical protein